MTHDRMKAWVQQNEPEQRTVCLLGQYIASEGGIKCCMSRLTPATTFEHPQKLLSLLEKAESGSIHMWKMQRTSAPGGAPMAACSSVAVGR